jgi:histidinol-phosphate aminotransferase
MKKKFFNLANDYISQLVPYQPGKPIETLERELGIRSAIKLASNENPLGPSPKAMLAVERMLQKVHFYPDGGCFEFKQKLSQHLSVKPEQITVGNGSENILELIVKAYLHKDDHAVISQYAFLTIPILIDSCGAKKIVAPAKNYAHDVRAMINAVDNKTRVLFLVNPNNPTGTYTSDVDFRILLEAVPPDVLIVVDEAYAEYIKQADYPNTLAYLEKYPNLIFTRTFSKIYGLAGLRLGYAVSSVEIADILNRARLPFNVNSLAAKAGCAALDDREHLEKSILINDQGLRQLVQELQQLAINYIPSVCNFITIEVDDADRIYHLLLEKGVIVRPLKAYGMPNHLRVTVGTVEENKRFLEAMSLCQITCTV